jgi:hypothetical protein
VTAPDEHKLLRDAGKAARARDLLANDLLIEAFKGLEEAYVAAWRNSPAMDTALREKQFMAVNVVDQVRRDLAQFVINGRMAEAEIAAIANAAERKARAKR